MEAQAASVEHVELSTSPWAALTHWGHNLLVFDSCHQIGPEQDIGWKFQMNRNRHFPRHYHLKLEASPMDTGGNAVDEVQPASETGVAHQSVTAGVPGDSHDQQRTGSGDTEVAAAGAQSVGGAQSWFESKFFPLWR